MVGKVVMAGLSLGILSLAACGKDSKKATEPPAVTFDSVSSIITRDCGGSGCHNGTSQEAFSASTTKADATAALRRIALVQGQTGVMPPSQGKTSYDKGTDGAKVKAWLESIK